MRQPLPDKRLDALDYLVLFALSCAVATVLAVVGTVVWYKVH